MLVERVPERHGGVLDAATLRRFTSRPQIRVALARGRIVRDGRGRYALPGADEDLRTANGLSGVLCLDSAARQHGWKLKHQPTSPAVAVPRNRKVAPERRTGVRVVYVDLDPADVVGMVTGPLRTVTDCAARLPFDEALAIPGIGRPDLVDRVLRLVVEAESFEFHGKRRMLKHDCERYNAFVVDGWLVVRFAWST